MMPINLLESANRNGDSVILYGAGKYGRIALKNIRSKYPKVCIRYFADDDLKRNNKDIEGIQVTSLNNAIAQCDEGRVIIVIANYYIKETIRKIERAGVDLSKVFFSNEILIEPIDIMDIQERRIELSKVYDLLEDYESKLIYRTMVESRYTYNIDVLSRTCRDHQYFPTDIFQLGQDEIFVDGGAFDGDTIDEFLGMTEGRFQAIYAFEPDYQNYSRLSVKHRNADIKLFNMGLYSEDGVVSFSSGRGGSSVIEEEGVEKIEVCNFDALADGSKDVSLIKMDIEGSELDALKGMKETICRCRPKLAICIYHKFEDLWEIPLFIKELVPDYKLYIRNYTTYLDEIVLYAVV